MYKQNIWRSLVALLIVQNVFSFFAVQQHEVGGETLGTVAAINLPNLSQDFVRAQQQSWQKYGSPDRRENVGRVSYSESKLESFNVPIGKSSSLRGLNFNYNTADNRTKSKNDRIIPFKAEALTTENAMIKIKNTESCKNMRKMEDKIKILLLVEKKAIELEKLVEELKQKHNEALKEANNWKSQWTLAVTKIVQLEDQVKTLSASNINHNNKSDDLTKKLTETFAKLKESKEALEKANSRLHYFAALQEKHILHKSCKNKLVRLSSSYYKSKRSEKSDKKSKKNDTKSETKTVHKEGTVSRRDHIKKDKKDENSKKMVWRDRESRIRDRRNFSERSSHHHRREQSNRKEKSKGHNRSHKSRRSKDHHNSVKIGVSSNSKHVKDKNKAVLVGETIQ